MGYFIRFRLVTAKKQCYVVLCVQHDDKIVIVSKLKKSFFGHFCVIEKEPSKTRKQWNNITLRHFFCFLLENLKLIKIIRKREVFSNVIKILCTLDSIPCWNIMMLFPVTLQFQHNNLLSLLNKPVKYKLLSKILVILFT